MLTPFRTWLIRFPKSVRSKGPCHPQVVLLPVPLWVYPVSRWGHLPSPSGASALFLGISLLPKPSFFLHACWLCPTDHSFYVLFCFVFPSYLFWFTLYFRGLHLHLFFNISFLHLSRVNSALSMWMNISELFGVGCVYHLDKRRSGWRFHTLPSSLYYGGHFHHGSLFGWFHRICLAGSAWYCFVALLRHRKTLKVSFPTGPTWAYDF